MATQWDSKKTVKTREFFSAAIFYEGKVIELYLKSLEIQGFKSFPEKTRFSFDKPVTAIVGPNGSGKSNIADAILWVMGEQSTRTLRGGRMEDVIFGGTQRRSQVGFAEVSLILDNSDGVFSLDSSEVMITRRYYRSGDSEYFLNRSLVRLKDVNELLMDTGLGREGYSIISQGRIDEILSTKSKDRRNIFEEAAGISRYRHRKEESERKLQQTQENLLRVGDKISELELQLDPLRIQAETARKFLLLRDELRGLEISVWLKELDALRLSADKAETDHIAAKSELDTASHALESGYQQSEIIAEKTRECDVDAEGLRETIMTSEAHRSDIESAVAVLRSQLEGNSGQIERLNEELQGENDRQGGVKSQIQQREERLNEISLEKEELTAKTEAQLSELSSISSSSGESSNELSTLLNKESTVNDELSDSRLQLSALASQAQELLDREGAVGLEISGALISLQDLTAEYESFSTELSTVKEETDSLGNVVNGLSIKAQNRIRKAEDSSNQINRMSIELKTIESRRNMLADMEKEYQGYSRAVRLVMQDHSRGTLRNIHGTVGSLLKTDDRYAAAIETALGGALQNIIVDSEEDGKAAINHLKRRDGGRATFLPLSTIRGNILKESEVGDDPGFEGVAFDLVGFDGKYSGVYANLLGRVVIADDLNSAVRIAKMNNYRFKVVTLDSQVVNAGGSMTGGSSSHSAGVLTRANELENLRALLESNSEKFRQAQKEHAELEREKNAAEYELNTAGEELRAAKDKLIMLESEDIHRRQTLTAQKAMLTSLEDEFKTISGRSKLNLDETDETKSRISTLEAQASSLKDSIDTALRGQEELSKKREQVNAELSELRARGSALEAEYDALTSAVSELTAIRDEMSGNRERQLEVIEGLKRNINEIRNDILNRERDAEAVSNQLDKLKEQLSANNSKKLELEAERTSLDKSLQDKNQSIRNLERECLRLEQRMETAKLEEKQIIDKLWDTYELSRSAAVGAGAQIDSINDAQKRISSLKRQISELGNPNIGAIEEFDRVNTRYTFLTTERDDVEKAKEEITGIISDIITQMREIFSREFSIVGENFERTFKELFGGGRASLSLEDPDDVLGSGIEIQVQPPGKSLKTISLLSGGEKALVAIAIYFAILNVRPPPFVVMDEIDAALDETNVLRYAAYMRKMSVKSQMIVITHKRATMEEADVLFGITMQELGVSSMVQLDLDEAERHIAIAK